MLYRGFLIIVLSLADAFAAIIEVPLEAPSIQSAFDVSQEGDTILLAQHTFRETVRIPAGFRTLAGVFLFSGNPIDRETTVLMPADTVQADTACILLMIQPCSLRIVGLTFEYGRGVRRTNGRWEGGAIYAVNAGLLIEDCNFQNCFADFGVCAWTSECNLTIRSSFFRQNGRIESPVFSQGCIRAIEGSLIVESCRFTGNTVTGAAAIIKNEGVALVENCVLDSNNCPTASLGIITSDDAHLTVRGCRFLSNTHGEIFAGACIGADSIATIEDCEFSSTIGQCPLALFGDTAIVRGCVFEDNHATVRNPACIALGNGYNLISNSTFRGNSAPMWSTVTSNNTTYFEGCHFESNVSSDDSGAVMSAASDSLVLVNCVLENNFPFAFSTDFWWFDGYVDARNCYWGAPSGPYQVTLNPDGEGDAISGADVLFVPWLSEPPLSIVTPRHFPAEDFRIERVYPNPFNSLITVQYVLGRGQRVQLVVYDLLGRHVVTLRDDWQVAGSHAVSWTAEGMASGVYLVRLSSQREGQTVKVMLLK